MASYRIPFQSSSFKWEYEIATIGDLRAIWNKEELKRHCPGLEDEHISFARTHLLRTISLLVHVGEPDVGRIVLNLIQEGRKFDDVLHMKEGGTLPLRVRRSFFNAVRPQFTAPVLTEGEDFVLEGVQQMPLVGPWTEGLRGGMNAIRVTKHTIPPGHLRGKNGVNRDGVLVVRKTLDNTLEQARREIDILDNLRLQLRDRERRDGIGRIAICTSFTKVIERSFNHCLSFAAKCDLKTQISALQSHAKTNGLNKHHFLSCLEQMRGIAEALRFLHNTESNGPQTWYCHMDIKPQNIVVFETGTRDPVGRWQLIDFGITTMSKKRRLKTAGGDRDKTEGQHITYTVGTTPKSLGGRYQPAEINTKITRYAKEHIGELMGRGSDVWALGCVFAEVVAANLGNLDRLPRESSGEAFYQKRPPARRVLAFSKYRRHPSFETWLEGLKKYYNRHAAIEPCRYLIDGMTHVARIQRLRSDQVLTRLERLLTSCVKGT